MHYAVHKNTAAEINALNMHAMTMEDWTKEVF